MKRRVLAVLVFAALLTGAFHITQAVIEAKFIGDSTTIVDGFYAEEKNSIDMVMIGSSNCFCTIDPLVLYEEYGIAAYDFASSSQPMNISLLYLKEVFRTQQPKVVALEVNYIPAEGLTNLNEQRLRWGLTSVPLSLDKLACIYQSTGAIDEEFISHCFPLLRYHNRWRELSKIDFTYFLSDKTNMTKGYLKTNAVTSQPVQISTAQEEGETWVEEDVLACLDEMVKLCRENDTKLVLFKSPREDWYGYQGQKIRQLAEERGLLYVDYNLLAEELGLDYTMDFRDTTHLNDRGAAKVTRHFGAFVQQHYELPDRREDAEENSWDRALYYQKRLDGWSYLQEAKTVMECNALVQDKDDFIMVVTYRGVKSKKKNKSMAPRQWVYKNKELIMEQEWTEEGIHHEKIGDSELVLRSDTTTQQVIIDNMEYNTTGQLWSVVIYDLITGEVAISLGFDE